MEEISYASPLKKSTVKCIKKILLNYITIFLFEMVLLIVPTGIRTKSRTSKSRMVRNPENLAGIKHNADRFGIFGILTFGILYQTRLNLIQNFIKKSHCLLRQNILH